MNTEVTPDNAARHAVKRYFAEIDLVAGVWRCVESDHGEWISYFDHAATVAALEAEVEAWRSQCDGLNESRKEEASRADAAERRVAELEAFISAGIEGAVVEMGDDEDGNPRVTLHTSREQIKREARNLMFKQARLIPLLTGARAK